MEEIKSVKEQKIEKGNVCSYWVNNEMCVPISDDNRHYLVIKEWIEEGNTPEPADE